LRYFLFLLLATLCVTQSAYANLTLAVVEGGKKTEAQIRWGALGVFLGKHLKDRVKVVILRKSRLERCLESRCADLFIADPVFFVEYQKKFGLVPLATRVNNEYGKPLSQMAAVIIAESRRPIYAVKDLDDTRFVWSNTSYFLSKLAIERVLLDNEIDPKLDLSRMQRVSKDDLVLSNLVNRASHFGAIPAGLVEQHLRQGKLEQGRLRVIGKIDNADSGFPFVRSTTLYPEWPFFVLPTVPEESRKVIQEALLSMTADSFVGRATKVEGWIKPLSYAEVDACLERVGYGPYEKLPMEERLKKLRK
jgi:ABC-type phosphate/phosphonate transport system substrate-binding protein